MASRRQAWDDRRHPPLIPASRQIRLLSFREHAGAILSCDLTVHNLTSCPQFVALSYTWGEPLNDHEIRLNDVPFTIRDNLCAALENIRRHVSIARRRASLNVYDDPELHVRSFDQAPERWYHFWIDAICIKQTDVDERNHQVSMMQEIYSSAAFVLVWLGVHCEESLDFIVQTPRYELEAQVGRGWQNPPEQMRHLIHADYWSRMWIVQEFVLAPCIIIGAGSNFLPWSYMQNLFPPTPYYAGSALMNLVVQERHERSQRKGFYRSLATLLYRFTELQCLDVRDKIFAVLGLFSDEEHEYGEIPLQADYSLRPAELYQHVMNQARYYLNGRELETLRVYVSSALMVDPEEEEAAECRSMRRRRGSRHDSRQVDWDFDHR